jgi:hypothetical protein
MTLGNNQTYRRERIEGCKRNTSFVDNPDGLAASTITSDTARNIRKEGGSASTRTETISGQYGDMSITTLKGSSNLRQRSKFI